MPQTVDEEVRGLKELQRKMEGIVKALHGAPMLNGMRDATMLVERDAKLNAPVNTGRLRASITPDVRMMGAEVVGVVGSSVVYAPAVEFGSAAHMPPVSPIVDWVHKKKIAGTYSIKTRKRLGSKTTQTSEDLKTAWAIAIKISQVGTPAHPYLIPAFEKNRDRIERMIDKVVYEIVNTKAATP